MFLELLKIGTSLKSLPHSLTLFFGIKFIRIAQNEPVNHIACANLRSLREQYPLSK